MNIEKINNINFKSQQVKFKLTTKDGRALSNAIRQYAKTSSENYRIEAFNIFDKYMVQVAQEEAENGCIFEDYLQNLRLHFLEKLEFYKKYTKRISIGITNSMRYIRPTEEDKTLDKIDNGDLISLGGISKKQETYLSLNIKNDVEKQSDENDFINSIRNTPLISKQKSEVLALYNNGYSIEEIANITNYTPGRIKMMIPVIGTEFVVGNNLNNIQNKLKKDLKCALLKNGCNETDTGLLTGTKKILMGYKSILPYQRDFIAMILEKGTSFEEALNKCNMTYSNSYYTCTTITEKLNKKQA